MTSDWLEMTDSTKRPSGKASKGSVVVAVDKGYLRLQLPRALYSGKQKYITLGLSDTPQNRKAAEAKAKMIQADIVFERFDFTLEKYTGKKRHLQVLEPPQAKTKLKLGELWERWCEYKRPMLAETTYRTIYCKTYAHALREFTDLEIASANALELRDWLLQNRSKRNTGRILDQLLQAYEWAIKNQLAEGQNHFYGLADEVKKMKNQKVKSETAEDDYIAFTKEERDAIINEFETHKRISHWANFVKFLFWTGCRPGEAIALRWKHIKADCSAIYFCESHDSQLHVTKPTKTGESRWFKCGERLQQLLLSMKPELVDSDELVFKSKTGKQVSWTRFAKVWNDCASASQVGTIKRLVEQGKVKQYLKPYATRHTFITLQLHAGTPVEVVAKAVGNSPEVIYKHYLDIDRAATLADI